MLTCTARSTSVHTTPLAESLAPRPADFAQAAGLLAPSLTTTGSARHGQFGRIKHGDRRRGLGSCVRPHPGPNTGLKAEPPRWRPDWHAGLRVACSSHSAPRPHEPTVHIAHSVAASVHMKYVQMTRIKASNVF